MIKAANLYYKYQKDWVLQDINFQCKSGEIIAIMGCSGGGKTTLLKALGGLLEPTSGCVTVDKRNPYEPSNDDSFHIGYVFQYSALFDYMDIKNNILFGLRRKKPLSKSEENSICNNILKEVHLEHIESFMPSQISGGMKKRVALARSLVMNPSSLFYDEPTSGLDPVTAYSVDELIYKTAKNKKITSIFSTHDPRSAIRIADKVIFLKKGSILFEGNTEEFQHSTIPEIQELLQVSTSTQISL